jgi:general secretion pathway protein G
VEQRSAEVRSTRAEISTATTAVAAWRADHDHAGPASVADVVAAGYLPRVPRDAWGRPLRLTCPGRRETRGFDISSDGPDGIPGGTDRVQ